MNRLPISLVIIVLILFSACTIYKEYPIEVYKPGDITIPPEVKKAAVVYRNFKYPGDSLQNYFKIDNRLVRAKNDPDNLDSIMVSVCINKLANKLDANNSFDQIKILRYNMFKRHISEKLPDLSPGLLKKIGNSTGVEWLILLETFSWFFSKYSETLDMPESQEVITVAVWGIYDISKAVRIERKTMIDTVFWNGYDEEGNYIKGYRMPERMRAMPIAAAKAGENYANRFYASWQTVYRNYSVPPLPDFSDAAYYFEEGKFDIAIALWKKYSETKNGKLAIKARYNLALAYEMKDEIETAQKWLKNAYSLAVDYRSREDLKMIRSYEKILSERLKEIQRIN